MKKHMHIFLSIFLLILFMACNKKQAQVNSIEYYFTDCDRSKLKGDYFKDSVLHSTHEITFEIQAEQTGKWNIKTETINGMSFSGSGEFTTTGLHNISLKGTGKPLKHGLFQFRAESGANYCSFIVKVDTIAVAPCAPENNSITGLVTSSFYSISKREFGGLYQMQAFSNNCDLQIEFAGTAVPKSGAYRIKPLASDFYTGDVRVSLVAMNIYFQSSDGVLYVNNTNGTITVTFCNIRFLGSNGAVTYNNTASARISK